MRLLVNAKDFAKVVNDWRSRGMLDEAGLQVAEAAAARYADIEERATEALGMFEVLEARERHPEQALPEGFGQLCIGMRVKLGEALS